MTCGHHQNQKSSLPLKYALTDIKVTSAEKNTLHFKFATGNASRIPRSPCE